MQISIEAPILSSTRDSRVSSEAEPVASKGIRFKRYLPPTTLVVGDIIKEYKDIDPETYNFRARIGPSLLRESHPELYEEDKQVAENLASQLVQETKAKPDIVIVCSSHLPEYDENNPDAQHRANHVRRYLQEHFLKLGIAEQLDGEKPENTHTESDACSSFVMALHWLRQQNPIGKNVLLVVDETGYRKTLPPPADDESKSRLIFSDGAAALQFTYGKDLTVLASTYAHDANDERNAWLKMRTPFVPENDPYVHAIVPPYSEYFKMNGKGLLEYFSENITSDILESSLAPYTIDSLQFAFTHQASIKMVRHFRDAVFPKIPYYGWGVMEYGNMSSASTVIDLEDGLKGFREQRLDGMNDEDIDTSLSVRNPNGKLIFDALAIKCQEKKHVDSGDTGIFMAYGGGLTWAAAVVRFGPSDEIQLAA